MMNYQNLFDGIVYLLETTASTNVLAKQCLLDCDLELAFTPAKKDSPVSKNIILDINKRTDEAAYGQLQESFENSGHTNILIWYIDTENGGYSIFTDVECKELIGIKTSKKTLQETREGFFNQKETLAKIGEQPTFDYSENEITFINKKLIK